MTVLQKHVFQRYDICVAICRKKKIPHWMELFKPRLLMYFFFASDNSFISYSAYLP